MKSYDELKEEFDETVEKLRNGCPHKELSEWMEYFWAPAHSTGELVKSCKMCRKIVRRLRPNFKFTEKEKGQFVQEDLGWQELDENENIVELSEDGKKGIEETQKKNEEMNSVVYGWTDSKEKE